MVKGIILSFLFIPIIASSNTCLAFFEKSVGTVTSINGVATIKRPGVEKKYPIGKGDAVLIGDEIRTENESSIQLSLSDSTLINIFEKSILRINQYSFDIKEGRRTARIRLLNGKARFMLFNLQNSNSRFYAQTDNALVSAALIADFALYAQSNQTEVVCLKEVVRIKNLSPLIVGEITVEINQKAIVKGKQPPSRPETLSVTERKGYTKDVRKRR